MKEKAINLRMTNFGEQTSFDYLKNIEFKKGSSLSLSLDKFSEILKKGWYSEVFYKVGESLSKTVSDFFEQHKFDPQIYYTSYGIEEFFRTSDAVDFTMIINSSEPDSKEFDYNLIFFDGVADMHQIFIECKSQEDIDKFIKPLVKIFFDNTDGPDTEMNRSITNEIITDKINKLQKSIDSANKKIENLVNFRDFLTKKTQTEEQV